MSSSASSWPAVWSFSRVARIDSHPPKRSRILASSPPTALRRTVTLCLRSRPARRPPLAAPPAQRLEQPGDALLALAVYPDAHAVALVDLELEPGGPAGYYLA